mgnify:CR=1 FL=1
MPVAICWATVVKAGNVGIVTNILNVVDIPIASAIGTFKQSKITNATNNTIIDVPIY